MHEHQSWRGSGLKGSLILLAALAILATGFVAQGTAQERNKPQLVLQITVDQLRGDLPARYYDRLGKGGLRFLLDSGTVYTNAHHRHANTETIVGHATLATGADPSVHGMVGNVWLDRASGELTYNVEDARYPILSEGAGVDQKTEIDSTQKTARSDGRSPSRILVSTFSDELTLVQGGKSKVFGVSVKDRGAISMAGHTGKAFWFSKKSSEFVSRRAYGQQRREVFAPEFSVCMGEGSPIAGQCDFVGPVIGFAEQIGRLIVQQLPCLAGVLAGRLLRVPIGHPLRILVVVEAARDELAGFLGKPKRLASMPGH